MKSRTAIKIKALSLLIVFSLNMIMGFACSLGIDMGYNSKHHHKTASTIEQNAGKTEGACHTGGNDERTSKQHDKRSNSSNEQDCCSHGVLKFLKLDKNVSPGTTSDIIAPVILVAIHFAYQIDLSEYLKNNANNTYYFTRTHHPPIPDIRIAIHSFLI